MKKLGLLILSIGLAGCGGHTSNGSAVVTQALKTGGFTVTIKWPQASRVIPDASNYVQILLLPSTSQSNIAYYENNAHPFTATPPNSAAFILARPSSGSPLTVTTPATNMTAGSYTVLAEGYPTAILDKDGKPTATSGNAQSRAIGVSQIVAGKTDNDIFTMDTTVAGVKLNYVIDNTPVSAAQFMSLTGASAGSTNGPTLREDQAVHVIGTPVDANQATILVTPSSGNSELTMIASGSLEMQNGSPGGDYPGAGSIESWVFPKGAGAGAITFRYQDGSTTSAPNPVSQTYTVNFNVQPLTPTLIASAPFPNPPITTPGWITDVTASYDSKNRDFRFDTLGVVPASSGSTYSTYEVTDSNPVWKGPAYTFASSGTVHNDAWIPISTGDSHQYVEGQAFQFRVATNATATSYAFCVVGQPSYDVLSTSGTNTVKSLLTGSTSEAVDGSLLAVTSTTGNGSTLFDTVSNGSQTAFPSAANLATSDRFYISPTQSGISTYVHTTPATVTRSSGTVLGSLNSDSSFKYKIDSGNTLHDIAATGDLFYSLESSGTGWFIYIRNANGTELQSIDLTSALAATNAPGVQPYRLAVASTPTLSSSGTRRVEAIVSYIVPAPLTPVNSPDGKSGVIIFSIG